MSSALLSDKYITLLWLRYITSICLIRASSNRENSSDFSSDVWGFGSQSSAWTISKLNSLVGAGFEAANGEGGTFIQNTNRQKKRVSFHNPLTP